MDIAPTLKRKGIELIAQSAQRVHPERKQVELLDGSVVDYDYLVIATGPKLAFEEVPGLGPDGFTQSICHVSHAEIAKLNWDKFTADPGPIVVGAVQGASCFGPAYEYAMIMDTDLRRRKIRDKVPMTYVTSEPYIGHLGLGGVGDSKGLLESAMRERHIKWICNAKVTKVEAGKMYVTEHDEMGVEKKQHELPFGYSMMLPAFKGVDAVFGIEGLTNPRGFITVDKHQRNQKYKNIFSVGVCVAIPPVEPTPIPVGTPKTGYMIESMVTATAHNIGKIVRGGQADEVGSWNAICLADFGDGGIAVIQGPRHACRTRVAIGAKAWCGDVFCQHATNVAVQVLQRGVIHVIWEVLPHQIEVWLFIVASVSGRRVSARTPAHQGNGPSQRLVRR